MSTAPTQGAAMDAPMDAHQRDTVLRLIDEHRATPGALLPLLHAVQDALGYIPPTAVPLMARALGLSRAEVHGVITFYHHFRQVPPGRHVVQMCRAEACQARGGDALYAQAQAVLRCGGGTRADGAVTLEPVYCLGLCASAPAMVVDDRLHARLTPTRLEGLLRELRLPRAVPLAVRPVGAAEAHA